MSHNFSLISKQTDQVEDFKDIDVEMCKHFSAEHQEKVFYNQWYRYVGFSLATGITLEELKQLNRNNKKESDTKLIGEEEKAIFNQIYDEYLDILNWLDENYSVKSWRE